jgi:glycosyltransferase involved in cell wall biosynthesis
MRFELYYEIAVIKKSSWPKVSIITPTLNSERTLELCFKSIQKQNYPGEIELIVADGGSKDKTIEIAKRFGAKICRNILITGEAGKALGVKKSTGDILVFIDSDNILPTADWIKLLVKPFLVDKKITATEPLFFTYRKEDHWLTRYFALLGMGDPLSLFIGNYDRYSFVSNKWTSFPIKTKDYKNYITFFVGDKIPTIGANGFLIRRKEMDKYLIKDYLFDMDVLKFLALKNKVKIAKVKIGIVHLFSGNISTFIRKQRRRARDYFYYSKIGLRTEEKDSFYIMKGVFRFIAATLLLIPLFVQSLVGYLRKKDIVWIFHSFACWITLIIYSCETLRFMFIKEKYNRTNWKQ